AIHDMNGVLAEHDQLDGVPRSGRLLVVGLLDATAGRTLDLRKKGPLAGRIIFVQRRLRAGARLRPNGDRRSDRVEIADIVFLDLQLDGARPGASVDSRRGVNMVKQT